MRSPRSASCYPLSYPKGASSRGTIWNPQIHERAVDSTIVESVSPISCLRDPNGPGNKGDFLSGMCAAAGQGTWHRFRTIDGQAKGSPGALEQVGEARYAEPA